MKTLQQKYFLLIILTLFLFIAVIIYFFGGLFFPHNKKVDTPYINTTKTINSLLYSGSTILNNFNKKNIDNYQTAAGTYDLSTMASTVTNQMLKAFSNTTEKALPLVSNWNAGIPQYSDGLNPMYMIERLANGEHILPSWKLAPYYDDTIGLDYYEASIKKAAELGLPLVFILPSPESALTKDDVYFSMDKTQNPNVVTSGDIVLPQLSPFAPDALWNEVGEQWSSTSLIAQLQELYPDPPLVLFVDEDTSSKLSWSELSSSSRYAENYPANNDDEFKRNLVNAAWVEKYRQLHDGIKKGFTQDAWKNNIKFVSRNQLASDMGRTSTWLNNATTTKQYANIWPLTTDVLTIDFNLDEATAYIDINNFPFMLDEAKQVNPNFTYELSINANSTIDNPEQYRGLTQFALWFLRPSIIRQTPNQTTIDEINPLFQQVVDSVNLVNGNEILADFWKNGKLLKIGESTLNSNVPIQYQNIPRWFLLKTNSDKNIWSFAIEKGEVPNREWLVYFESPESNLTVTVTIPDFADINIDTTREGSFYILSESQNTESNPKAINFDNTVTKDNNSSTSYVNYTNTENPFIDIEALNQLKNINTPLKGKGKLYYIDSVNGQDDNDGLSVKNPWKTLQKIKNSQFALGDSILLKRNSVFHENIWKISQNFNGTENNPVTIGTYGEEGKLPVISAYDEDKNTSWTFIDNDIWKMNHTFKESIQRLSRNNQEILVASDFNEMDGKRYIWYYDSLTATVYIKSKTNPNLDTFSYSNLHTAIFLENQHYVNIQDIEIIGGYNGTLTILNSSNINIHNCVIGKYAYKAITIVGNNGYICKDINITNNIIDANFVFTYPDSKRTMKGPMEGIVGYGGIKNLSITNNYLSNFTHACINFFQSPTSTSDVSYINIHHNYITGYGIEYGGRIVFDGVPHNIDFSYNFCKDIAVQNQFNGHDHHIHHNIFDHMRSSPLKAYPTGRAVVLLAYSGPVYNNLIEYNTIINNESEGIVIDRNHPKGDTHNNTIRNNILYNCGLTNENIAINIIKPFITDEIKGIEYNNKVINNIVWSDQTKKTMEYYFNILTIDSFNQVDSLHMVKQDTVESLRKDNKGINPFLIKTGANKYHSNDSFIDSHYGAFAP